MFPHRLCSMGHEKKPIQVFGLGIIVSFIYQYKACILCVEYCPFGSFISRSTYCASIEIPKSHSGEQLQWPTIDGVPSRIGPVCKCMFIVVRVR